jgi:hypothetical protein
MDLWLTDRDLSCILRSPAPLGRSHIHRDRGILPECRTWAGSKKNLRRGVHHHFLGKLSSWGIGAQPT